jgi:hypothetical protein
VFYVTMDKFIPLTTKRYKKKGCKYTRRHFVKCGYCESKVKSLKYHMNKYHKEEVERIFTSLSKGSIESVQGIKFYKTD